MQSYLDRTSDIQTVASIVGRCIMGGEGRGKREEWMEGYREWLNKGRMWKVRLDGCFARRLNPTPFHCSLRSQLRAKFDIARSSLIRSGNDLPPSNSSGKVPTTLAEDLVNVPKQLFVRCNYCNVSLPLNVLRRQEGSSGNSWLTQNSWLSREPPILKCCPSCRKPLPRCYVCLLSLGCLNPYLELKRQRELKRGGGGTRKMGGRKSSRIIKRPRL